LLGTTGLPSAAAAPATSNSAKSLRSIMATGVPPCRPSVRNPVAALLMRA
jgi:hypothetical protein